MRGKRTEKIRRGCLLLLAVSLLCTACSSNKATDIQLKKTEGSVGILNEEGESLPPQEDMKLYSGYEVSTRKRSHAWMNLDNVKLAKLDASSQIEITKNGKDLEILVNQGKLYFHVTEPLEEDETLNIRTSTMAVGIRGTCGWVEASDEKEMKVYILEGTVECSIAASGEGQKMTASVSGGEMAELTFTEDGGADIHVEPFTEEDVLPFVREELEQDEDLRKRILEDSGLDFSAGGRPGSSVSQALEEIQALSLDGTDTTLRDRISLHSERTKDGAALSDGRISDLIAESQEELIESILGGEATEGAEWMKSFADALSSKDGNETVGGRDVDYMQIRMGSGINCYKPNIYLYGEAGTAFEFTFKEPELLTKSLPEYKDSWNVEIARDGKLTVNGEAGYPYLFYESVTIPGMYQQEEGFLVQPWNRVAQLEEILLAYGLNGQEIQDFTEFWDEMLDQGKAYLMYPQATETVDRAMPLEISGTDIEHYFRLWFCFQEAEEDSTAPPRPEIVPAVHQGTALVEWGGMLF